MAKVYIENWVSVKDSINQRRIVLFVQFKFNNLAAEVRSITDAAASKNATVAYNIIAGDTGGVDALIWEKTEIFLTTSHSQLPVDHKIIIESYLGTDKKDDDNMDTGSAPTW